MAWSDRPWILDGAAVRVSMVGFDNGSEKNRVLDGKFALNINPSLQDILDLTSAKQLSENSDIAYMGITKGGDFDIPEYLAQKMLNALNTSKRSNQDVLRPYVNGMDIARRPRNMWLIDFGVDLPLTDAALYELPFAYVMKNVKPFRDKSRRESYRDKWWIHMESRPGMRIALKQVNRYIVTPIVSKHRVFVWLDKRLLPDKRLMVFARQDDYFFGVLHSYLHEIWSLQMGSWHGKGNDPRYTNTTCYETFPFPWPPGQEPTDHPAYKAISAAAKQLHEERDAWLNPPGVSERALKDRTLTNLYNALLVFRGVPAPEGKKHPKIKPDAGDFAPRLDILHRILDEAVCDAYGWDHAVLDDDEEILRLLLALNLERAEQQDQ